MWMMKSDAKGKKRPSRVLETDLMSAGQVEMVA